MSGRAWIFGDDVDTDALAPGAYMKGPLSDLASHCLESLDPTFAEAARPGDIVVAGRNFGAGSSREQAAEVLKVLGVKAVLARSFAGIFYRNAFNLGLSAIICPQTGGISAGDRLSLETEAGIVTNETTGGTLVMERVPAHLAQIVKDGGLMAHLKAQRSRNATQGIHEH